MSTPDFLTVPTSNPPTLGQVAVQNAMEIRNISISTWKQHYQNLKVIWSKVWQHPTLTPQQTIAGFGTGAKSAFTRFAAEVESLASQTPTGMTPPTDLGIPAGYSVFVNSDGSAVATFTPLQSSGANS